MPLIAKNGPVLLKLVGVEGWKPPRTKKLTPPIPIKVKNELSLQYAALPDAESDPLNRSEVGYSSLDPGKHHIPDEEVDQHLQDSRELLRFANDDSLEPTKDFRKNALTFSFKDPVGVQERDTWQKNPTRYPFADQLRDPINDLRHRIRLDPMSCAAEHCKSRVTSDLSEPKGCGERELVEDVLENPYSSAPQELVYQGSVMGKRHKFGMQPRHDQPKRELCRIPGSDFQCGWMIREDKLTMYQVLAGNQSRSRPTVRAISPIKKKGGLDPFIPERQTEPGANAELKNGVTPQFQNLQIDCLDSFVSEGVIPLRD
jgi:hypothetical protein